jgi:hypothetical protein
MNHTSSIDPRVANYTAFEEMISDLSNHISVYKSEQQVGYAVVRPSTTASEIDWSGTSYAVSTKCSAVPRASCTLLKSNTTDGISVFNCPNLFDGKNQTVYLSSLQHMTWFYDWHRDLAESPAFTNAFDLSGIVARPGLRIIDNTTIASAKPEDTNTMFRNPWRWLASAMIPGNSWDLPKEVQGSPLLWRMQTVQSHYLLSCSTTGKLVPWPPATHGLSYRS